MLEVHRRRGRGVLGQHVNDEGDISLNRGEMPGQGTPQSHIPISLSGPLQGRPGRSDFLLQGRPPGQQAFQGTGLHLLICAHPQTNLSKIEGVPCLRNSAFRLRCCKAPLREAARRKRSKTKIKSCLRHGSNSSQAIAGGEGPATMTSQPSPGPKIATTTCKKKHSPSLPGPLPSPPPAEHNRPRNRFSQDCTPLA